MTNEEGIINGIERGVCGHCRLRNNPNECLLVQCKHKIIKDAIYKTIPKTSEVVLTIKNSKDIDFKIFEISYPKCPICKTKHNDTSVKYCSECGNRLKFINRKM